MKILINSLQVSHEGSKGHLHPAIEIGLTLQQRGHEVVLLPLPCSFNKADREQLEKCNFVIIEPPPLPKNILFASAKLAQLAKNVATTPKAYHSFLVAPLEYQFEKVIHQIKTLKPDIVVYDLLVYVASLAARYLGITEVGYCAGLKLIAPSHLTTIYQSIYQKLAPSINHFLKTYSLTAEFHNLELLSNTYQIVFSPAGFIKKIDTLPRRTILAGSLPISRTRSQQTLFVYPNKHFTVLCFGSVLDPADYLEITKLIIKVAGHFKQHLIICTQKPHCLPTAENITVAPYLPLVQLLKKASLVIHHGGANTFSESLTIGVPQIIIPLTTDQPIQAELLKSEKAGIAIYPNELAAENLVAAFRQLLDKNNVIHKNRRRFKRLFKKSNGARAAANLIEQLTLGQ